MAQFPHYNSNCPNLPSRTDNFRNMAPAEKDVPGKKWPLSFHFVCFGCFASQPTMSARMRCGKTHCTRHPLGGPTASILISRPPYNSRKQIPEIEGRKSFMHLQFLFFRVQKSVPQSAKLQGRKNHTATDVTGFDVIFSTGFFATFSRFCGARLTKLRTNTGEKAKNPVESLQ